MEGQEVVTSDDQKLGAAIAERDDCVVIETGHLRKTKHAIPRQFLHEQGGVLRATVTRDIVSDSPKVDLDAWDPHPVREHYGLVDNFVTDPDPNGLENAETASAQVGQQPAPAQRAGQLGDGGEAADAGPVIRDRMANANDPTGVTANLSDRNRTGG